MFDIFQIISGLRRNIRKRDIFLLIILIALFFATRLINIEKLPIFTDEGIYIQWAKTAWHDASWRFISLTDGRQPLQTWATIPLLKLFPDNALLAGRLFGVLSGFAGLIGMMVLLGYMFGKRTAFIGPFEYIYTPYFLFYERMALMDPGINAAYIWLLFFSVLLVRTLKLDIALIYGMVAGISLLAKSSTQLFVALSLFAPVLFKEKRASDRLKKTINYFILLGVVFTLSFIIYNVQRLSPFLHFVAEKNKTFILTLPELLKNPFGSFQFNFYIIPYYILTESGLFLPIVGLIGWIYMLKKNRPLALYLGLWIFVPYIIIAFVARVLYPRYIMLFASMSVVFCSYLIDDLARKKTFIISIALLLFFVSLTYFNYTIMFDYQNIPFPTIDRGQYITGGSSGYGIRQIIDYVRTHSANKPGIILAEGNFGMAGDVLGVFVKPGDNFSIKSYWPLDEKDIKDNFKELTGHNVYVVYVYKSEFPHDIPLKQIAVYTKPGGTSSIHFFQLLPK